MGRLLDHETSLILQKALGLGEDRPEALPEFVTRIVADMELMGKELLWERKLSVKEILFMLAVSPRDQNKAFHKRFEVGQELVFTTIDQVVKYAGIGPVGTAYVKMENGEVRIAAPEALKTKEEIAKAAAEEKKRLDDLEKARQKALEQAA